MLARHSTSLVASLLEERKEFQISSSGHRSKEPKPRLGEILVYEPDRAQGILYSLREGRTLPFKLADSPGLPGEILRPGIQVHFFAAPDDSGGHKAVQLSLEAVASLDARLRYVARRAARRARRAIDVSPSGAAVSTEEISSAADDIAFMGAGVSEVTARGRRGPGAGRREREKPSEPESNSDEESQVKEVPEEERTPAQASDSEAREEEP